MYQAAPEGLGRLVGHVAKGNLLWQVAVHQELLVVFQGPSTYISPNGYASKHEAGMVVPTWNDAVVHVHGTLTATQDPADVKRIVGITVQIRRWQGKWKVSQNQPERNRQSVAQALTDAASDAHMQMASLVQGRGAP